MLRNGLPIGVTIGVMLSTYWTEEEKSYLRNAYPSVGVRGCAEHLKRPRGGVYRQVQTMGLKRVRLPVQHIDMSLIKTPRFAYLLGFLWADGWVSREKCNVSASIQWSDAEALKPILDYTGKWAQNRRGTNGQTFEFRVWDKAFNGLLRELDYPDKSRMQFRKVCTYLGSELTPYFIHGFFDGDGSIMHHKKGQYVVSFAGRHDYDWSYLQELLQERGVQTSRIAISHKGGERSSSALSICRKADLIRFYAAFLDHPHLGLPRKDRRFREFLGHAREMLQKPRGFSAKGRKLAVLGKVNGQTVHVGTYDTHAEAQKASDRWEEVHAPERVRAKANLIAVLDRLGVSLHPRDQV